MIAKKKTTKKKKKSKFSFEIDEISKRTTKWIGSNDSLFVHSAVFMVAFLLPFIGVPWNDVLLVITTLVSLEAIYLAIFIQMTVNKNTADIEEIQEDIDEIQEDVDEIQEDVEEIEKDIEEDEKAEIKRDAELVQKIEGTLAKLLGEIEELKKRK